MMMRMMSDPAARLLDEQSMLQLSGVQVNQLIALHESTLKQTRAVADQIRAMFPRAQGQDQAQATRQRPQLSQQQRDNLATLMDSLRTIRWRATSAADSVLTADQRHVAMRLAMARRSRMRRGRFGAHGGMMRRMDRGGPNEMRMPPSPNDSGPSGEWLRGGASGADGAEGGARVVPAEAERIVERDAHRPPHGGA